MRSSFKFFLSLSLIILSFATLGCGSPSGGGGTSQITITLGVDSTKAALVGIDQLRHEITFSGPTGTQRQTVTGRGTARATVVAGLWTIDVVAYYGNDLYAVGGTSAEVRAGHNTDVSIQMTVVWTDGGGVINPAISYDVSISSWYELEDYITNLPQPSATTIQLSANLVASTPITINEATTVTLVTPIYTTSVISRDKTGTGFVDEMFDVLGTLNLGHGTYPDNSRVIIDGAFSAPVDAPLITINRGTLNMYSGVILQNNELDAFSPYNGGSAVSMDGGVFNIKGGIIRNNKANNGGGVYVHSSSGPGDVSFFMSGGTISGNEATTSGGGVNVDVDGIFEMTGGTINGNNAQSGGGVYGNGAELIDIKGDAKIYNNTAENMTNALGGGIYFYGQSSGRELYLGGNAEITGNKAICSGGTSGNANGGGVFIIDGTFVLSENAKINFNTAVNLATTPTVTLGGGVYIEDDSLGCDFSMTGGEIRGNTAQGVGNGSSGGGVYVNNLYGYATFSKIGGLIDGYSSGDDLHKNKVLDENGSIFNLGTEGHAVYVAYPTYFGKNTDSLDGNVLNTANPPPTNGLPGNGWDF